MSPVPQDVTPDRPPGDATVELASAVGWLRTAREEPADRRLGAAMLPLADLGVADSALGIEHVHGGPVFQAL